MSKDRKIKGVQSGRASKPSSLRSVDQLFNQALQALVDRAQNNSANNMQLGNSKLH